MVLCQALLSVSRGCGPQISARIIRKQDTVPLEVCTSFPATCDCACYHVLQCFFLPDTCIFIHDRSDYKAGWQIEKEWQEEQRKKQERLAKGLGKLRPLDAIAFGQMNSYVPFHGCFVAAEDASDSDSDSDSDSLPFACHICRKPFQSPVVTQ